METNNIILHEPVIIGSTFYGDSYDLYEIVDGERVPVDLTGAIVRMDFKDRYKKIALTLKTADNTLQISGNSIIIPEMIFSIAEGEYLSDFAIDIAGVEGVIKGFAKAKWKFELPITETL